MTWVTALILMTLALPALLARLAGGYPPNPGPELAALAPLAVMPAAAAVIIAAYAAWWLAALLAIPAALLVMWQLPPLRRARLPGCARTIARNGICCDIAQAAPVHRERQGRCGRPGRDPSHSAAARRGCTRCPGTDPAHGDPAGGGRAHASASVFSSGSPARFARHRLVGALAADSATAGPGSDCRCAAGAHRSAGRASGDADRGTSTRSRTSTRSHARARGHLAA